MNCKTSRNWISRSLDAPLSGAQRQALEAHVATCSQCARVWSALRQVDQLLTAEPMLAAPPGFADRVLVRLESEQKRARPRQRNVFMAVAGTALLAATLLPMLAIVSTVTLVTREPAVLSGLVQAALTLFLFAWEIGAGLWTAGSAAFVWLLSQPLLPGALLMSCGLSLLWIQMIRKLTPGLQPRSKVVSR